MVKSIYFHFVRHVYLFSLERQPGLYKSTKKGGVNVRHVGPVMYENVLKNAEV